MLNFLLVIPIHFIFSLLGTILIYSLSKADNCSSLECIVNHNPSTQLNKITNLCKTIKFVFVSNAMHHDSHVKKKLKRQTNSRPQFLHSHFNAQVILIWVVEDRKLLVELNDIFNFNYLSHSTHQNSMMPSPPSFPQQSPWSAVCADESQATISANVKPLRPNFAPLGK